MPVFNFSRRKVGGIWFIKIGRINLSFSVSRPAPRWSDDEYMLALIENATLYYVG